MFIDILTTMDAIIWIFYPVERTLDSNPLVWSRARISNDYSLVISVVIATKLRSASIRMQETRYISNPIINFYSANSFCMEALADGTPNPNRIISQSNPGLSGRIILSNTVYTVGSFPR